MNFKPVIPAIGTHTATKNHFFSDTLVENNTRLSPYDMFFKPFSSEEEAVFNARHLAMPFLFTLSACVKPGSMITVPVVMAGIALGLHLMSETEEDTESQALYFEMANAFWNEILQYLVDVILFPVAALAFVTRSIATGVDAVIDLCNDENANDNDCYDGNYSPVPGYW